MGERRRCWRIWSITLIWDRDEGLDPDVRVSDVRDIAFESEFDGVYMVLPAIGFFDCEEDDQRVLDGVCRGLRSGGWLYLHLVSLEGSLRQWTPEKHLTNRRGDRVVKTKQWDAVEGRMLGCEVTQLADGRTDRRQFSHRLYSCPEMRRMLEQAGFRVAHVYGDWTGSAYSIESTDMIMLAQKRD